MPDSSISASLGSLLAATVAFAIGTSVVLRDRRRDQFVLFAVFCFNLGLYHLARFFFGFSGLSPFGWFATTVSLLLPWSADRSLSSFVPSVGHRRGGRTQTLLGGLLVAAQTVALVYPAIEKEPGWEVVPWLVAVYVFGGLLWASLRVWRAARAAEGTATAARLRYLFYASLGALAFGWTSVQGLGAIVTAVYLYFVAQTLVRERLLDLPEVALRILSLSVLVVVVTALYALLLAWVPTGPENRGLFIFNAAVATFAVLVLVEPIRTEIESRFEGWVFRDRPVLRRILVQLRSKLAGVIDTDEMAKLVMGELQQSGRITQASLYLLDRQGTGLVLTAHVGALPLARLDLATRRPLIDAMMRQGSVLRDVIERERARERPEFQTETDEVLGTLQSLKASLALPIIGTAHGEEGEEPELLGALFVDDERLLEPFSREEVVLFEGVVTSAATTIQNSQVYEDRKERDRLAALGEMAAGLAHEIRNPLGAIKGAVEVMQPDFAAFDEHSREFLGVIVEEVDRLNRVVSQFLTYSRPFKGEHTQVELARVVTATLRLLTDEQRECIRGPADPDPDEPALLVRGDPDALRQVLLNLLLNALDAIGEAAGGRIWIDLSLRRRGLLRGDAVALDVCDNGPGLSAKTMTNLFVPFHTTKSGGTGLGLPISRRIVENHHGTIEVGKTADGGARFTVLLPATRPARRVAPTVTAAEPAPTVTSAEPATTVTSAEPATTEPAATEPAATELRTASPSS